MRGRIGPNFKGLTVMSESFVELGLPRENHTQAEMSVGLVREDSHHFLEMRLSCIKASLIRQDASQQIVSRVVVFCDGDRVFEEGFTITPGAELEGGHQQCGDQDRDSADGDCARKRSEGGGDFGPAPDQHDKNPNERKIRISIGHRLNAYLDKTNHGYQHSYKPEPANRKPRSMA